MKKPRVLIVLALLIGALFIIPTTNAHDGEDHNAVAQNSEQAEGEQQAPAEGEETVEQEQAAETYAYVAQEGDSYSVLARKAVQTYGIVNGVNLSGAEIIFAETNLTRTAGSPELSTGQDVSISSDDVKQWVEAAQALSDEDESNWDYYVQFVDFNTDAAGEAQS